ncbi:hypothetical protein RB195_006328 [Necator americanus]|uniref:Uncharacterized protein n=2 Tax=Necator americanus TaxID=51031 RepID=A0ABR1BV45_NECAM
MDACPTSSSVMLTDAYLAALNIPRFKCDRGDKEQLKMHLLCSMLCCPKQIRDDETVSAETVNANIDVSRNYLNFYTVGRVATNEDRVEMNRISKNLERVFQLPLFATVVEMDGRAKFRPIPPECIKPLYHRILRGGQCLRRREWEHDSKKEAECNTPEAVYRAKVACNFLLELIEREVRCQKRRLVDWQSVQRRYQEMFNEDSEDKELMEFYKRKYGLEFRYSSLNGDMVKIWTNRSTITKALSLPVFHKIYWETEEDTGKLCVGFKDDIRLYDDEELEKSADAIHARHEMRKERTSSKSERGLQNREMTNKPADVIPLRQRKGSNVLPDVVSSPFASLTRQEIPFDSSVGNKEQQRIFDMNEPQYIPTSGDIINLSASEPESEESMSLEGVYTDDEEHDNSMPTKIPEKNATTTGSEQNKYDGLKRELPPRRSPLRSFPAKPYYAGETQPEHAKDYVEPFRNPWEIGEDEMPTQNKNTGKQQKHLPSATRGIKTQAESIERPQSLPRHLSAFASCKSRTNSSKRDSEVRKVAQERNSPAIETEMQTPRRDLYERRGDEQSRQELGRGALNQSLYESASSVHDTDRRNFSAAPNLRHCGADPRCIPDESATVQNQRDGSSFTKSVFSRPLAENCVRSRNSSLAMRNAQASPTVSVDAGAVAYSRSSCDNSQHSLLNKNVLSGVQDDYGKRNELPRHPEKDDFNERKSGTPSSSSGSVDMGYRKDQNPNPRGNLFRAVDESCRRDAAPEYKERLDYSHQCPDKNDVKRNFPHSRDDEEHSYNRDMRSERAQRSESFCRNANIGSHHPQGVVDPSNSRSVSQSTAPFARAGRDPLDSFRAVSRQSIRSSTVGSGLDQGENYSNTETQPLTADQEARLRIIRDFTFLHRNVKDLGFRCLSHVMSMLPPDDSVDWVRLIRERLPEVEIAPFKDMQLLVWRGGSGPNRHGS